MPLLARFKIVGHSMEPQIRNGAQVLVSNLPYWFKKPRLNDIVAFTDSSNKILVKRIIKITKNAYFVQGDNKGDSLDSRSFGNIIKNQIIGKVLFKL
jgi:nickel-type superoxide dismutase maturation protease